MSYRYYDGHTATQEQEKFKRSTKDAMKLGHLRLHPPLWDEDYLIFFHRAPVIAKWLGELEGRLCVLDIGGRIQPYRSLIEDRIDTYIAVDLQLEGLVNVIANAEKLPFERGSFDVVICTDVLQYVPDAASAIREMHRVLKSGGKLILSTRGSYPEHHDELWRFLPDGLRYMCRMFSSVDVVAEGYTGSGLMITLNVLLHRRIRSSLIQRLAKRTTIPLLNKVGLLLDKIVRKDTRCTCGFSLQGIK